MSATKRVVLHAIETDAEATQSDGHWETRCLHCRSRLSVAVDGTLLGSATLEHIVPRSWFPLREARDLCSRVDDEDDPRNLSVVCARCNHDKGTRVDADGPRDPRAREVIETLLEKRSRRWRPRA
jgi:5-methylcytosine-specific restriction endonuclease McrA